MTNLNADESVAWNGYSGLAALACVVNPRRCEGVCLCCYVHFLDSFRGRTEGNDDGDTDFLVLGRKPRRAGEALLPVDVPNVQEIGVARGGDFKAGFARGAI